MATLISDSRVPYWGWYYVEQSTGYRFEGSSYQDLVSKVRLHRAHAGLSVDGVEEDIQRQLCLRLDRASCRPEPGEEYRPVEDKTRAFGADHLVRANKALASFLASGASFVDTSLLDWRADVCARCPFNRPVGSCSCSFLYAMVKSSVPEERRRPWLGVCAACGCSLALKANLPQAVIENSNTDEIRENLPPWCWQSVPAQDQEARAAGFKKDSVRRTSDGTPHTEYTLR